MRGEVARSMSRRVGVIGGGAAGLFCARLLALQHPDWDVAVYERLAPNQTFGFGVGLRATLLDAVRTADPEVYEDIIGIGFRSATAEFRLPAGTMEMTEFHSGVAIGRSELLQLLMKRAVDAGVDVRVGESADVDELREAADLVVAADGVSSATRATLADVLEPTVVNGRGLFVWCGSETELRGTTFVPVETEHGVFVAHAYPYAPGRSTLVIETDDATWRRAGLDDAGALDPLSGESDQHTLDYLSQAYSDLLEGRPLVGNKSRWTRFRTVRCARWSYENVVVIGDAAATAHPSLGSGTKLAMESALALAAELRSWDGGALELRRRLVAFEEGRRPGVTRAQDRATRSQGWWESFPTRMNLTPAQIAVAFYSRAGVVSLDALARTEREMVTRAAADFAGVELGEVPDSDLTSWVLRQPLDAAGDGPQTRLVDLVAAERPTVSGTIDVDCDDPWGPQADQVLETARVSLQTRPGAIALTGDNQRTAVLDRLAVAERVRNELGAVVIVAVDRAHLADAADGLVSGRTDLVTLWPSTTPSTDVERLATTLLEGATR